MAPGVTVIEGSPVVTALPFTVAVMLRGVPTSTPVKVAVYVPLLLSVTALNVPVLLPEASANATVAPPTVRFAPVASRAISVTVVVVPLCTLADPIVIVDVVGETTALLTVMLGAAVVTAVPPMVAPIDRAVPAVLAVKVAVYVPFALSVTAPIVPSLVPDPFVNVTVDPPDVSELPAASFAVSVSATTPPTATLAAETDTREVATDAGPGVTVNVGCVVVTADPFSVAEIARAVPATTPVNAALYVPLLLSVTAPIVPVLVPDPASAKATVAPPAGRFTPAASFACRLIVSVEPLATVAALTDTVDVAADGPPPAAALTVIVGDALVTGVPPIVAPMLRAVPAVVAVNVAV
jgi:hypothetical protein